MFSGFKTQPITSGEIANVKMPKLRINCQNVSCFRAKRRCGCMMPAMAIVIATYSKCGVYADSARQRKNDITSSGCTRLLPTILEPSQRMRASQKTYMISAVPFPARKRKAVESVVRIEPIIATSFLNQRLRRRMIKKPAMTAMMMDGNFIAKRLRPRK